MHAVSIQYFPDLWNQDLGTSKHFMLVVPQTKPWSKNTQPGWTCSNAFPWEFVGSTVSWSNHGVQLLPRYDLAYFWHAMGSGSHSLLVWDGMSDTDMGSTPPKFEKNAPGKNGCFRKWWYPQIIHFNRDFHYKASILGSPHFWKHPNDGWKMSFLLGLSIFRGYVKFPGCILFGPVSPSGAIVNVKGNLVMFWSWNKKLFKQRLWGRK